MSARIHKGREIYARNLNDWIEAIMVYKVVAGVRHSLSGSRRASLEGVVVECWRTVARQ